MQQKVFRCLGYALTWKDFLTSPCSWIHTCLRKADKNKDNKMSLKELKDFLKEVNIEVDDYHAKKIFQVMGASRKRLCCWLRSRSPTAFSLGWRPHLK